MRIGKVLWDGRVGVGLTAIIILSIVLPPKQVAMLVQTGGLTRFSVAKTSDDVASRVYPKCSRAAGSAGKIYRNGLTFTQQKAMSDVVGAPEQSHNFASGVNPARNGESSAWDIDSRKFVPTQETQPT